MTFDESVNTVDGGLDVGGGRRSCDFSRPSTPGSRSNRKPEKIRTHSPEWSVRSAHNQSEPTHRKARTVPRRTRKTRRRSSDTRQRVRRLRPKPPNTAPIPVLDPTLPARSDGP